MGLLDAFKPRRPDSFTVRGQPALNVAAGAQAVVGGASAGERGLVGVVARVSGTQPGSWIAYVGGYAQDGKIIGGRAFANGYTQQTQPYTEINLGGTRTEPYGTFWVCVINGSTTDTGNYEATLTVQEA